MFSGFEYAYSDFLASQMLTYIFDKLKVLILQHSRWPTDLLLIIDKESRYFDKDAHRTRYFCRVKLVTVELHF